MCAASLFNSIILFFMFAFLSFSLLPFTGIPFPNWNQFDTDLRRCNHCNEIQMQPDFTAINENILRASNQRSCRHAMTSLYKCKQAQMPRMQQNRIVIGKMTTNFSHYGPFNVFFFFLIYWTAVTWIACDFTYLQRRFEPPIKVISDRNPHGNCKIILCCFGWLFMASPKPFIAIESRGAGTTAHELQKPKLSCIHIYWQWAICINIPYTMAHAGLTHACEKEASIHQLS